MCNGYVVVATPSLEDSVESEEISEASSDFEVSVDTCEVDGVHCVGDAACGADVACGPWLRVKSTFMNRLRYYWLLG